jgi:hypothetical protein
MTIVPISLREANDFVTAFHRHNGRTSRDGGKFAIGLTHEDVLVGVAIVGNPLSATYMDGISAEVLRTCTNDKAPKGAVSKLYSACWKVWQAMGGRRLITYTLKSESGSSLRGAGWKVMGETKAMKEGAQIWRKNDGMRREWQPIYGQQKLRWEVALMIAVSFAVLGLLCGCQQLDNLNTERQMYQNELLNGLPTRHGHLADGSPYEQWSK